MTTPPITRSEREAVTKMLNKYSMVWRTPADYFKKYEAALTAAEGEIERLRAENERLRKALYLVECQDQGCGGNLNAVEIYQAMQRIARAALEGEGQPPPQQEGPTQ